MPQNLLAIHGVTGLVVAVGNGGRIMHFEGDLYHPVEVGSPTQAALHGVYVQCPHNAWAVGENVILHWDGKAWATVLPAAAHDSFGAVWGHADDGVWLGGLRSLINIRTDGTGGNLITTDLEVRSIWGSSPSDVFYLASERLLMHWDGDNCESMELPGDPDEEWNTVTGSGPEDPIWVVGLSGFIMQWDRRQWFELDAGIPDTLMSACCAGPDLYVTTDEGLVRQWDGKRWRTVAFSAFGALTSCCFVDGVLWACGDRGVVLQHQPDDNAGKE